MVDNTNYIVVNAPKQHQRVIGKLMTALGRLFYLTGEIPFEPFCETMIDEAKTSPTPDILLFDNIVGQNIVIVEISSPTGVKKDFEKVVALMLDYDIPEGFVYNYVAGTWLKYKLGVGQIKENPSFCEAIGFDLNAFV